MTTRELNRATLARQLLLRRDPTSVADGVRRVLALQAQEPASPYVALWNRLDPFDPADLDRAFADGTVVKATLMRITLHAVHIDDYRHLHTAMQRTLRPARLHDRRFRATGLSPADADALIPDLQEFAAEPRTKAEAELWLEQRLGASPGPGLWWALRQYAPILRAPTGGPWSFASQASYVTAGTPPPVEDDWDQALQVLIRRYLEAFGPASYQDIAQFVLGHKPPFKTALHAMHDELERLEGPDGTELYDVPGSPRPDADTVSPPRLLPMWDSVLLAHADRSRVIRDEYRPLVMRRNGDVLPTLLVDGQVAGVWRPVDGGIEATSFDALTDEDWSGLEAEAAALVAFLADREPGIYARYHRWWEGLPAQEIRLLRG